MSSYEHLNIDVLQIKSILHAIDSNQHANLLFDDEAFEAQGLILGADFEQNTLLLSETHPDSSHIFKNKSNHAFWLRLKSGERYLNIALQVKTIKNGLLTVHVKSAFWCSNKRWRSRISFPSLVGPKVRVVREFASNLDGHLHDLSPQGAAIDIWGKELNRDFKIKQTLPISLLFNQDFEVPVEGIITASQFLRSPSCHTRIRMRFIGIDAVTRSQLSSFIDTVRYASPLPTNRLSQPEFKGRFAA